MYSIAVTEMSAEERQAFDAALRSPIDPATQRGMLMIAQHMRHGQV